jgi:hypothetical protein
VKKILTGAVLLFLAGLANAQLKVEILQKQEQFLPGEELHVSVRVINRSGQVLTLGTTEDWLTFSVESRDGSVVQRLSDPPVLDEFKLESSQMATKQVNLEPHFGLTTPGRYRVVATVRVPGWGNEVNSAPKFFDIIEGSRLWAQDVGLPKSAGSTNAVPETRRYTLQQANYLKGRIRLYLRVTDPVSGRLFRLLPIGSLVSFSRPEPQVDKQSRLHLLYQNGPHTFLYAVFSTEGDLILRRTYELVDSRPRLRPDEEGHVVVMGGTMVPNDSDFPGSSDEPVPVAVPIKPLMPGSKPLPEK